MDQKQLIVAAMQQGGLTSFYQLAQRLGVTDGRVSNLRHGKQPADEAEIAMLADMAGIDLHIALAAVHKDREKNPAKRAYWEKIALRFSMAVVLVSVCFFAQIPHANAANLPTTSYKLCEIMGAVQRGIVVAKLPFPNPTGMGLYSPKKNETV